jgi:hypothetical protein
VQHYGEEMNPYGMVVGKSERRTSLRISRRRLDVIIQMYLRGKLCGVV